MVGKFDTILGSEVLAGIQGLNIPDGQAEKVNTVYLISQLEKYVKVMPILILDLKEYIGESNFSAIQSTVDKIRMLLNSIYADSLIETARALKLAALASDSNICINTGGVLISGLQTLFYEISRTSAKESEMHLVTELSDLESLAAFIDRFEIGKALELIRAIQAYCRDIEFKAGLSNIEGKINCFDYDGAAAECARLLNLASMRSKTDGARVYKVLAIDDSPDTLNTLRSILQNEFNFFGIVSVEMAEKFLEKQIPDIIILDIEMPVINGYEFAARLKASRRFSRIPIIFLTGNAYRESVVKAIEAGGCDYCVKPVEKEILLEKVYKNLINH